ncbi:hypothetical protein BGZ73_008339 [Actinomortierella ambigua]|nr:hypothetical protein BGZ73_008339 [Actinomortierella ambigua]
MPVLLLDHSTALSIGGILRYRIRVDPVHGVSRIKALHFRIRNTSPVYRNLTPTSGPWKIAVALVRAPPPHLPRQDGATPAAHDVDRMVWCQGIVPELSPSVGCGHVCRFTATVDKGDSTDDDDNNGNKNEWELEVLSEMVTQKNWLTVRVEVLAELENKDVEAALERQQQQQQTKPDSSSQPPLVDNKDSKALDGEDKEAADIEDVPQVLLPDLISCEYKDTAAICGANVPRGWLDHLASVSSASSVSASSPSTAAEAASSSDSQSVGAEEGKSKQKEKNIDNDSSNHSDDDGLHLVVLTHGIHGSWLDLLYIKEQIDRYAEYQYGAKNRTVTFLSDTNHAGTEEGLQMAGRRVARDILEMTGFWPRRRQEQTDSVANTDNSSPPSTTPKRSKSFGARCNKDSSRKPVGSQTKGATSALESADLNTATTATMTVSAASSPLMSFPRGFRRISFIGHSLGGLINMYALGYIEAVTKGRFFRQLEPVHFTALASPLLGVGLDHPWVLGYALSKGMIGQTGKDLSMEDRSTKSSSSLSLVTNGERNDNHEEDLSEEEDNDDDQQSRFDQEIGQLPDCELDQGPDPLLLAMARPGSITHRVLKRFRQRILYGNIENDLPVQYNTCTLMGIPGFDRTHFFSPDGPASGQRRNMYHVALQSYMSILFPRAPAKAKWMQPYSGPSPIVAVHVSEPLQGSPKVAPATKAVAEPETVESEGNQQHHGDGSTTAQNGTSAASSLSSPSSSPTLSSTLPRSSSAGSTRSSSTGTTTPASTNGSKSGLSSTLPLSTWSARALSLRRRRRHGQEAQQETVVSRTTEELAQLVADGYQTEMAWTKIGVYLQSDAHVQIIVRRKWYNVDGWPCVRDFVERHDFS